MIFEKTDVFNFCGAFRGMRNPMDSWEKSDSHIFVTEVYGNRELIKGDYTLGQNDLTLAQKLIKAGPEHSKFMRQIFVSVDITAPLYWWSEFDTYTVGVVKNSCSTMHKLSAYPFSMNQFAVDKLKYDDRLWWNSTIDYLEKLRQEYNRTKEFDVFRKLKQALPTSYLQKRTVTMNYANLRTIYLQRKNHRLKEWSEGFIGWVKGLPYAEELITIE